MKIFGHHAVTGAGGPCHQVGADVHGELLL